MFLVNHKLTIFFASFLLSRKEEEVRVRGMKSLMHKQEVQSLIRVINRCLFLKCYSYKVIVITQVL